ncbi:MAG TPA: hypothetical protein VFI62_15715 [Burkholderiales bacterium]|nr:hypothetical protein [Burkholderiales bacterium]
MKTALCVLVVLLQLAGARAAERELIPVVPLLPPWYYDPFLYPAPPPQPRRQAPPSPQPEIAPPSSLPSREPSYWYCLDAKAYYPEVTRCPGGWQQVVPRNPPPPPLK